ncbi:MAG: hypothetical protein WD278_08985 [Pirellulales bacterium]
MRRSAIRWGSIGLLAAWLAPVIVWAQPVPSREPSSTHIFPAGGQRGTVVNVLVGAECLPPAAHFHVLGEGVQAPAVLGDKVPGNNEPSPRRLPTEIPICYPKQWQSRIEIAADAPLGNRHWWLSCARGGTGIRTFVVGDLPEFIESESNSSPERAERVELPVTINGQIAGERDIDYFVFSAREGEVITCDVAAARLGSPLEAVVELRGADGRRLSVDEWRVGSDPVLALRAPANGDYLLLISNLGVHGGPAHVYRVTLGRAAYRAFAFPPGGRQGESREVEFFSLTGDGSFTTVREMVQFDSRAGQFWWRGGRPDTNPVLLEAGDTREHVESEGNDSAASAELLELPVNVSGRFGSADDEDWFAFHAGAGPAVSIACRAFPPWLDALPCLELYGAEGAVLAACRSVDGPDGVCRLEWSAPVEGVYQVRVRDMGQHVRGGPQFVYRLSLETGRPDFSLMAGADVVNLVQGERAELEVRAARSGGFAGAIECSIEGLEEGVRCEPVQIAADQGSVKLAFTAEVDARPGDMLLRVVGRAVDNPELTRFAAVRHLGCDAEGIAIDSPTIDRLHLTVQHRPVFRLFCNEAYQYAHRGTVYPYAVEVERLAGFEGPITLQLGDRQNRDLDGIEFWEVVVPPGTTRGNLPVYLPETMHINVQSQSQVYAQGYALFTDRRGQQQSQLIVSEKRCMLRTLPTVARLVARERELVAEAGGSVECHFELERTPAFTGPMRIELVDPASGCGMTADPVMIAPGETAATLTIHLAGDAPARSLLRFRGTGQMPGTVAVVSEAAVAVRRK